MILLTVRQFTRCCSRFSLYSSRTRISSNSVTLSRLIATMGACFPYYPINAKNIEILENPNEFYQTLKEEISTAKNRITMAALYIGSDGLEEELVGCLEKRLSENSDVEFTILLDHSRGTRGRINSCTLLQSLVDNYSSRASVALYHSPLLRGLVKSCLPERLNETIGLNHIKVFVFDDNLLITGANLSESYFTNRQDRYVLVRNSPELAKFFHDLVATITSFSLALQPGGDVLPHSDCPAHPFYGDSSTFIEQARSRVLALLQKQLSKSDSIDIANMTKSQITAYTPNFVSEIEQYEEADTLIYPLIQMGQLGIYFDEIALNSILESAPEHSTLYLASGYFNLTDEYIDRIINVSKAEYRILSASPEVNGFYGASGLAGKIPDVYTQVSKQFCDKLEQTKSVDRVKLYEYYRPEWTFHVKGLWYYPSDQLPSLTLIGSPNFGHRSVHRDLEAQLAIVTRNNDLRKRFHQERERLYQSSVQVDKQTFQEPKRRVPLLVRLATGYIKSFF